ncbi:YdcF family protein [Mangrovivirga sp. M17]|uniref:YdcF family protein n=1 Tax=Mangrovivirga halotolerans TaxID=2993936 RepID=A0ABT3RXV4_9BACT|nr:ElyC/SanA/YdcF family protein [Mangrovivirga halotolerans]MCX2746188.1 YdcF family protein [Mangrovivirga halotolerans]
MRYVKKILKIGVLIGILSLIGIFGADRLVEKSASDKVFNSTKEIPHNKVGLFLGTGKILSNGRINLYYKYRIEAAVSLFKAGKVDFILVSGDNSTKDYDEPSTIKEDLIKKGIPSNKIYLDYAGFRTLDSVVRCKEIFGQSSITIISQQFHNERAIYIAKRKDIDAVGFNAKDVNVHYGFKTRLRERFARVKMVLDLIIGKKPKFLGDKIDIK